MANFWNLCTLSLPTESGIYEVRICEKNDPLSCPVTTRATYNKKNKVWCISREFYFHEVIAWRYINEKQINRFK